jgi:hypothetical protein
MMISKPPVAAAWLLQYLNDSPYFESILGDLEEFCGEGRSRFWYWRQAFVAIATRFAAEIWNHKLLAIKVLVTAWAFMPVYNLGRLLAVKVVVGDWNFTSIYDLGRNPSLDVFATYFGEIPKVLAQVRRNHGSPYLFLACAVLVLIASGFGAGMGRLVSRLHPRHRKTMVSLYVASIIVSVLPTISGLAIAAYSTGSVGAINHFLIFFANSAALIVGIVLAGLLYKQSTPATPSSRIACDF